MNALRILSYNIHKGISPFSRKYVLNEIRDEIDIVNADIVFLQEITGINPRHPESQFELLAGTSWPHFAYGKNAIYTKGNHGNAILSRFPIQSWENIDVSTHSYEKRGLLHAVVEVPGLSKPLHLICLHLGLFKFSREEQIRKLCIRLQNHVGPDDPVIVGGDFNDWNEHITHALESKIGLKEVFNEMHGKHARTFPSVMPFFCLDRIYYRGFNPLIGKTLTHEPWTRLSDHLALFSELEPV